MVGFPTESIEGSEPTVEGGYFGIVSDPIFDGDDDSLRLSDLGGRDGGEAGTFDCLRS
jgi:hypothetical protein